MQDDQHQADRERRMAQEKEKKQKTPDRFQHDTHARCKQQRRNLFLAQRECLKSNVNLNEALSMCSGTLSNLTTTTPSPELDPLQTPLRDLDIKYMKKVEELVECRNYLHGNHSLVKVTTTSKYQDPPVPLSPQETVEDSSVEMTPKYRRSPYSRKIPEYNWIEETNIAQLNFAEKGSLVDSVTFVHLVVDVPIDQLVTQGKQVCKTIQPGLHVKTKMNKFLDDILEAMAEDCNLLIRQVNEKVTMWFGGSRPMMNSSKHRRETLERISNARVKRQLLMLTALAVGGILAVGSTLFSHAALADISIGTGTTETNVKVLQDHETRVSVNEKSIGLLNSTMVTLAKQQNQVRHDMAKIHEVMILERVFEAIRRQFDNILRGLESLHNHRLSPLLIDPLKMNGIISRTRMEVESAGLYLLLHNVEEVYSAETSYIIFSNNTIRCITHLPAYRDDAMLTLYEYLPVPMPLSEDHFLSVRPEQSMLAISRNHQEYRTFSAFDLTMCKTFGKSYHCVNTNSKSRKGVPNCLFSLFDRDRTGVMDNCKFAIETRKDHVLQLAHDKMLLYHHTLQTAQLTCISATPLQRSVAFKGFRLIHLKAGCRVITPSFVMEGTTNIFMTPNTLALDKDLDLMSSVHVDILKDHLDSILTSLSQVGSKDGLKIHDMNKIFAAEKSGFHLKIGFFMSLIVIAIVVVLACCAWKCGCCSKSKRTQIKLQLPNMDRNENRASAPAPIEMSDFRTPQNNSQNPEHGHPDFDNPARTFNRFYRRPSETDMKPM